MKYGRTEVAGGKFFSPKEQNQPLWGLYVGFGGRLGTARSVSAEGDHKCKLESSFRGQLTFPLSLSQTPTPTLIHMHTRDLYAYVKHD